MGVSAHACKRKEQSHKEVIPRPSLETRAPLPLDPYCPFIWSTERHGDGGRGEKFKCIHQRLKTNMKLLTQAKHEGRVHGIATYARMHKQVLCQTHQSLLKCFLLETDGALTLLLKAMSSEFLIYFHWSNMTLNKYTS